MTRILGALAVAITLVAGAGAASASPSDVGPDAVWENVFQPNN